MHLRNVVLASLTFALGFPAVAATPAPAPPPRTTFETGGVTIWYEVRGSGTGTPLIVANGGPGFDHSYLLCGDVWDRLAKGRKVVFYDQHGNGRSSELKDGQPCGLAEQIDDLDGLRAHLGFEKIDLLGHSWGGYLVMAYAARHPNRIAHLMIVDSAAPKIQDTVFLFKNIYPETTAREDALAFAVELGDEKAVAGLERPPALRPQPRAVEVQVPHRGHYRPVRLQRGAFGRVGDPQSDPRIRAGDFREERPPAVLRGARYVPETCRSVPLEMIVSERTQGQGAGLGRWAPLEANPFVPSSVRRFSPVTR